MFPLYDVAIVHADALDFLRGLPDTSVDLVFGSPCYSGKGHRYPGRTENLRGRDWAAWMADIYSECLRVCGGLTAFVVDAGIQDHRWDPAVFHLVAMLDERDITLARPAIYYRNGTPGMRFDLRNDYELVVRAKRSGPLPYFDARACGQPPRFRAGGAFSNRDQRGRRPKKKKEYHPPSVANPGNVHREVYDAREVAEILAAAGLPGDVPYFPNGGGHLGSVAAHQGAAPFSQRLADFYVCTFCPPGGLVVDPFSGTGTTAAASMLAGRRFSGCDTDPAIIQLSWERLKSIRDSHEKSE